jgi:hypothetical protein
MASHVQTTVWVFDAAKTGFRRASSSQSGPLALTLLLSLIAPRTASGAPPADASDPCGSRFATPAGREPPRTPSGS